ncbi:nitroreductase [Paenibacillus urinalis]|uniref:Putative NAD(P)H nitroreductase n=1 Tax=Paenibacillus urinalis TaxID=521520 RepID=A0AAX3N643_9BACL|nr:MULTISPECIES: nitroreductase [Paenibacillus]WDH84469.1 nitroreductase [Paenibacillus urinalis]WDH95936.1 nitroreductase [Paenibacillus urinalis]WDI04153.1 nitroreductase [Paenibacillus urinalis]GAK38529.1 nitroreductase [Paenibacillus sp. TCA20]
MNESQIASSVHVKDVIRERRTIKKFKQEAVPVEKITELLDTAVWAPNHKLREPWRFLLFTGEGRQKLAEAVSNEMGEDNKFVNAVLTNPTTLLVVMKEDPRQAIWDEDFAATSALIQNFMLAAWGEEIGTFWVTKPFLYGPKFRETLNIVPGEKILGMIYVGYPDVVPKPQERTAAADKLTVFE